METHQKVKEIGADCLHTGHAQSDLHLVQSGRMSKPN